MIIETKKFKDCCMKILAAADNSELSTLTETLELKTKDSYLYLNITNGEYYMSVKFKLDATEEFHATVNAVLFLKLISQITTENIELICKENYLSIKANGNYKIPYIFDNDKLLKLPEIEIKNKTIEMNIGGDILNSILNYNSKELLKPTASQPIQKLYYLDQAGCLTFSSGACINNFTLEKPVRILLNNKLVKLFKLFKDNLVKFTLGYDPIFESQIQTKVSFETADMKLTAILPCDEVTLNKFRSDRIRAIADHSFLYSITLNTELLKQAVSRLLLFTKQTSVIGKFAVKANKLIISGVGENTEEIMFQQDTEQVDYSMNLSLTDLKLVLDTCIEQYITLNFGYPSDYNLPKACVLVRGNIKNILPECIRSY